VLFKVGALLDLAEVVRLAGRDPEPVVAEARTLAGLKGSPILSGSPADDALTQA
jgi:hypothetical protein